MSKYLDEAGLAELWRLIQIEDGKTLSNANKNVDDIKGQANGLATLDEAGKVPPSQLPSFVDDVLEYDSLSAFPTTGETGKVYVAKDTNKTYRWSGTQYTTIGGDLALGETSSTAFAGDRGKAIEDNYAKLTDSGQVITAGGLKLGADKHIFIGNKGSIGNDGIVCGNAIYEIVCNVLDDDEYIFRITDGGNALTDQNTVALTNAEIDNICK